MRRGGRMMLTAQVHDPRLPIGQMIIVATHLDRISDHSPIMLDLPLNEPTLAKSKRRRNRN